PQGEGDGVITATELYLYLRDQVEKGTTEQAQRQTPSLFNLARHDKGEFIFLHPRHRLNLPPAPDRNPFMGLSSFNEGDAPLFYGRGRVVEALHSMAGASPLLVVSGASGTGKSSVIKAGLLPQLRREGWKVLPVIRPGKEPMALLETELPDIATQLPENKKTVLVVDQYEELITQCLDPPQREAFE
ncbi:MAG: ATP-binding protein, partial [Phaeodactylibacter sp.]|nr:ATP-binding protein [Phaeodactylibacter sp.]